MKNTRRVLLAAAVATVAVFALAGCSKSNSGKQQQEGQGTQAMASAQKPHGHIKLVYVEWSSAVASTNVVKAVLEKAGYDVTTTSVSAAAMWQSVATGDADAMVAAWLPTTHAAYYKKVKDQVVNLGHNLVGTKIGLVVPQYVDIGSIDQLESHAKEFDGKIIGIDPGAGIMSKTEKAMKVYGLKDFTLVNGSGATMTGALKDAIDNHKPIVITGWTPHWMWARFKLKYLKDPKKVYGGAEYIDTIVRKGLKKDHPEAYKILDNFHWTPKQMGQVMLMNQKPNSDPYKDAVKWVNEHPKLVKSWMQ